VQVNLIDKNRLVSQASFKDPVHEISVTIEVSIPDAIIRDARVEYVSCPWDLCCEASPVMSRLIGMKMGRGMKKTVKEAVAGSDGCSHIGDLVGEVLKGLIQARFRLQFEHMGPEQRAEATRKELKGTCRSFSDPDREPSPRGNWVNEQMPH
jgi:hypothetical protein